MNMFIYILFAILSIILGLIIGCCLRLLDEGISMKWAPMVFKIMYLYTLGFVGFVTKNKTTFIEVLSNTGIEKGTENKREIINHRTKDLWALNRKLNIHLRVDGDWQELTTAAVNKFRKQQGYKLRNGKLGATVLKELFA